MVGWVDIRHTIGLTCPGEHPLRLSRHRRGHAEHSNDYRPLRTTESARTSERMVRSDPTLPTRRPCQRDLHGRARAKEVGFHRVAHSVNVRVRSLHVGVHLHSASGAELKPRTFREAAFRANAYPHDH
jgi:hypothetical protein